MKIYYAGNFSQSIEEAIMRKVLERNNEYRRLISFYSDRKIERVIEAKEKLMCEGLCNNYQYY